MPRKTSSATALALSGLALAACAHASSIAGSHPTAKASVSKAVQSLRNNRNAQVDLNLLNGCVVKALNATGHRVSTFRTCEHTAFPQGGMGRLITCGSTQFTLHYLQGKAATEAAMKAKCESIR